VSAGAGLVCLSCQEIARRERPAELVIIGGDVERFDGHAIGACEACLNTLSTFARLTGATLAVAQLDTPAARAAVDEIVGTELEARAVAVADAEAFVVELERLREGGRHA